MLISALNCVLSLGLSYFIPRCKAFPGTAGWPSSQRWNQLNETLGGRLPRPVPPDSFCTLTKRPAMKSNASASYNRGACMNLTLDTLYQLHGAFYQQHVYPRCNSSVQWRWLPFLFSINATTPEHVKAGVNFGGTLYTPAHRPLTQDP